MSTLSDKSMDSKIELYEHQLDASQKLKNGSVLVGGVGTGKTLTGLHFYKTNYSHLPLVVITTPKKRDENDWEEEAALIGVEIHKVDSWNNVKNYIKFQDVFFIFDEQRAIGTGTWGRSFISIARKNNWIMLTATPGDTWIEYLPLFLAHSFYPTKTAFIEEHVEYDRFAKFPKIKKYHNQGKLMRLRNSIEVRMPMRRKTVRHRHYLETTYDEALYNTTKLTRWNPYTDEPIRNASELTSVYRRIVATSDGRIHEAAWQLGHSNKVIVFYNFNYELEILRDLCEFLNLNCYEWNGQKHQFIPEEGDWVYLVQYTAGAEGWNCIETDSILFYSPNYSYKKIEQAEGRIDRLNTPFTDLNYIYLTSKSEIDRAVFRSITSKKEFNESKWIAKEWYHGQR